MKKSNIKKRIGKKKKRNKMAERQVTTQNVKKKEKIERKQVFKNRKQNEDRMNERQKKMNE